MPEPTVETTEAPIPESYTEYVRFRRGEATPEAEPDKPQEIAEAAEEQPKPEEESAPSEEEQDGADPDKPKGKGGFQRRIDKLTAKIHELEGRLATPAAQPKAEETKPAAPQDKPKLESFDSYDAYVEALTDWKLEQREKARREAEAKDKAEAEVQAKLSTWEQSQKAAREKHDDYDDALESVAHIKVPREIQRAIVESDQKAELAYHLAKNPGELERIVALEPLKAAIEIGKLEAKLTQPPAEPKPRVSAAPKPPKPVTPVATPTKTIYDADDYQAYRKLRMAELAKK